MLELTQWKNGSMQPMGTSLIGAQGRLWGVSNGHCLLIASIVRRAWHAMNASGSLIHGSFSGEGIMNSTANLRCLCYIRTLYGFQGHAKK
jgi:hypothetical protein